MHVVVYIVTVIEDNQVLEQLVFFNRPLAEKSFEERKILLPYANVCIASRKVITDYE